MGNDALMQSAYTQAATNSPEEQRKAALAVADRATDAADCALLLDVLGLKRATTAADAPINTRTGEGR